MFGYQAGSSTTGSNLLLISINQRSGDGALSSTTTMTYDERGNRVSVDGPLSGSVDVVTTRYDLLRRVVGVIGPDPDGAGTLKRRAVRYAYNLDDQPTSIDQGTVDGLADADWAAMSVLLRTNIGYDTAGRKSSASIMNGASTLAISQFSYDAGGRLECSASRMNPATFGSLPASACTPAAAGSYGPDRITRRIYDALDRLSTTQASYGTALQRNEQTVTYTPNGKMFTTTDARQAKTTYEYDGFDRLYRTFYPASQDVSSTTDYEQLVYDGTGQFISRRLRDGQVIGFTHDGLGRLQTRNLPGSELDSTYGYDNLGRMTSVTQSGHTLTFGYDALGRLRTQSGSQGTLTSDYDAAGRRSRLTWADGFYVDYGYLFTGEMNAIREYGAAGGLGVLATFTYDDLGRRTRLTRGNGTITDYHFNTASRLDQLTSDLAATGADQTVGLSYNPVGQIVVRTSSNDAYAWIENQNATVGYTPNILNQYTNAGGVAPAYDARGNLTSLGAGAFGYSSENMLTSAPGNVSLTYDPLGRLYQTTSPQLTTRFAYDGDELVAEYNASNQLQRRYVFGPGVDEPLVWYEGSGTSMRRWLHADERGSIAAISNNAGAQVAINRYDEYGIPSVSNVGRFQFTGQLWIAELKLYHFKARFYSPTLGRFMQTDPIGYAAGMNLYAYVRGDVINWRDPSGLMEQIVVTGSRLDDDLLTALYQQMRVEQMLDEMRLRQQMRIAMQAPTVSMTEALANICGAEAQAAYAAPETNTHSDLDASGNYTQGTSSAATAYAGRLIAEATARDAKAAGAHALVAFPRYGRVNFANRAGWQSFRYANGMILKGISYGGGALGTLFDGFAAVESYSAGDDLQGGLDAASAGAGLVSFAAPEIGLPLWGMTKMVKPALKGAHMMSCMGISQPAPL